MNIQDWFPLGPTGLISLQSKGLSRVLPNTTVQKMLVPWKKSCDKPRQHIEKQRHHFTNKGLYSQSYDFSSSSIWMWELHHKEGCALENGYFGIMDLEKSLKSPFTARRSNQSILKGINPEYSLKGLMLELKLQYFGHLLGIIDSLKKSLILWKTEGKSRRWWQRVRWLNGIIN